MNRTTKRIGALGTTVAAVAATGIAFAAWTATGTGAGAAKASSATDATVTATASPAAAADLWPGSTTAVPVSFSVNNPNPYDVTYSTFNTAAISSVTPGPKADGSHTCGTGDFDLSATSGNLAADVAVTHGSSGTGSTAGILTMKSTASDGCQGAVVTVTLKVAGSQD